MQAALKTLAGQLDGELHYDKMMQVLYATDASVYRELPLAVALPNSENDIKKLIEFATNHQTSLIPRAAGTSLAGQCVGDGIVVDISKYFNKILEFNPAESWVRVQPGVIRNELNAFLQPFGLFFSPITATATRAMIGGMVGNNSCGTTSIVYGSTRDHVLELKTILADGSEAIFSALSNQEFTEKQETKGLEGRVYRQINYELRQVQIRENIETHFPKPSIHRRNTGYAVDYLLKSSPFSDTDLPFDFCKLLCGSEGTLAFTTEIKIHLDPLPEPYDVVLAAHFNSVEESLKATQIAMKHQPTACELMDKTILDCTKENIAQSKNRFFVEGDPQAVLMVEFRGAAVDTAYSKAQKLVLALKKAGFGYAFPIIPPEKTAAVWNLRSAGLGLLANIPGDKKAVACIEDAAVDLDDLPDYIGEFEQILASFGQKAVYYAHAGAGELHVRPILDLKRSIDVEHFYQISEASAKLVKKYKGSLSGEHGDGRVRAQFIPMMVGEENYALFRRIKSTWDPNGIFNPGKIVDAAPMNTSLRYSPGQETRTFATILDFSSTDGILRAAEKCNGSGDCRKLPLSGGTMCPSYQATRDEKDSTRARANILREFLTQSEQKNPFAHQEIKAVMDLCLSCKGCTSECPSNVDMAGLKAEFLYQYYKTNAVPLRAKAFANINTLNRLGSVFPGLYNFLLGNSFLGGMAKKFLGIAPARSLPRIHQISLKKWFITRFEPTVNSDSKRGTVYLFCDEFTNFNDTSIGIKTLRLLDALGYEIRMTKHPESGRAAISKGFLKKAKQLATQNVAIFKELISEVVPLIGIEPSAILSFRDEYPRLVDQDLAPAANDLKNHCLLIEEFIAREIRKGKLSPELFTKAHQQIFLHGHCHQKSLADIEDSIWMLSLPENFSVELIPSGCCGMAGSFGYEKEHYEVSQKVGELVLFPAVRKTGGDQIIAAAGTSCRHQILDATGKLARHPIEILHDALITKMDT